MGLAATMRTEALVYGGIWALTAGVLLLWRRTPPARVVAGGVAFGGAVLVPLVANAVLEQVVLGQGLRFDRAVGTVAVAGADGPSRLTEALVTAMGLFPNLETFSVVLGAALLGLLVLVARRSDDPTQGLAALVGAGVCGIYVVRLAGAGVGFVPGLVAAAPLGAVGLAWGWRGPARLVTLLAVLPLPFVWRFQFTGGAAPQWGGRYLLVSGLLLGVVGIVALPRLVPIARVVSVGAAVAVTVMGLVWLSDRSEVVARAGEAIEDVDAPVLVSTEMHLFRELRPRLRGSALAHGRWARRPRVGRSGDPPIRGGPVQRAVLRRRTGHRRLAGGRAPGAALLCRCATDRDLLPSRLVRRLPIVRRTHVRR